MASDNSVTREPPLRRMVYGLNAFIGALDTTSRTGRTTPPRQIRLIFICASLIVLPYKLLILGLDTDALMCNTWSVDNVRLNIKVPEQDHRELKAKVASDGKTLQELVLSLIRRYLSK